MPNRSPRPRTLDLAKHIYAKRPRCKQCGSVELFPTRTICRDGDSIVRYVTCKRCGSRFILMLD